MVTSTSMTTHTAEVMTARSKSRAHREKKTVRAMVELYCIAHHGARGALCVDCQELLAYSHERIDKCPLIEDKPTCAKCRIHCYDKSRREQIRQVMRYSGPRMLVRHPALAIHHMIDGRRS